MCRVAAVQCQHSMMHLSTSLVIVPRCNTGSHHRYICGIFRLHVSTPKHYPPPRPRTWQRLVDMSAMIEVNARFPYDYALIPVISPTRLNKCQLLLTLIEASQIQSARAVSERICRTKDTPTPTISPSRGRSQTRGVHKPYRFTSTFSRSCLTTEQATVPAWPGRVLSCRSSTVSARLRTMSVATSRDEVSEMPCCGVGCQGRATCRRLSLQSVTEIPLGKSKLGGETDLHLYKRSSQSFHSAVC